MGVIENLKEAALFAQKVGQLELYKQILQAEDEVRDLTRDKRRLEDKVEDLERKAKLEAAMTFSCGPLTRSDWTEESMRVLGALRLSTFMKLPHLHLELLPLPGEISFISDHKILVSGAVLGEWLVVGEDVTDEWAKYAADEQPGQNDPPGSRIERGGTVRHHLRDIHFAPLALRSRLQLVDARNHFRGCFGLE